MYDEVELTIAYNLVRMFCRSIGHRLLMVADRPNGPDSQQRRYCERDEREHRDEPRDYVSPRHSTVSAHIAGAHDSSP
jgi:hypothetical protein